MIQTRNNYDLGIMNGSIGSVVDLGPKPGGLTIRFEDSTVELDPEKEHLRDIQHAFAISCHKAQGSEFPCVISIFHKSHSFMHHRNLLYTAVTRAQRTAILVGDSWGIRNCAQKQDVALRRTFLSIAPDLEEGSWKA